MTLRAVACATTHVGIAEESANGSSRWSTTAGTSSATCGARTSSWWSVSNRAATARAYGSSSYDGVPASKPIENVAIRPEVAARMLATTALESIPPEMKTPRGTSLSSRSRTASRSSSRTRCASSSGAGRAAPAAGGGGSSQYRRTRSRPSSRTAVWPGGSFATPARIERSAGV